MLKCLRYLSCFTELELHLARMMLSSKKSWSPKNLILLVGCLTCKTVSQITYTVLVDTLNTAQSINPKFGISPCKLTQNLGLCRICLLSTTRLMSIDPHIRFSTRYCPSFVLVEEDECYFARFLCGDCCNS